MVWAHAIVSRSNRPSTRTPPGARPSALRTALTLGARTKKRPIGGSCSVTAARCDRLDGGGPTPREVPMRARPMSDAPTHIRARQADQVLELTWEGGEVTPLPYRYLRGECPCAACRNEWTGERILDPATIRADLKLEGMEPVGNYAVRLGWNDGHSSGLYTWETLLRLSQSVPE